MRRALARWSILGVHLLLATALVACGTRTPSPPKTRPAGGAAETPAYLGSCAPLPHGPARAEIPKYELSPNQAYVEGVVIVTGPSRDVDVVASAVLGSGAAPMVVVKLGYLTALAPGTPPAAGYGDFEMRLYPTGGRPAWDVVADVYSAASKSKVPVFADPDYVTGFPPVTGSPWGAEGSPWAGPAGAEVGGEPFLQQWALGGKHGVNLHDDGGKRLAGLLTGSGVQVAVFDTAPFAAEGLAPIERGTAVKFGLCVSLPAPAIDLTSFGTPGWAAEHGLFVAGLVHVVAPDSAIHLIRVLDGEAKGDLFTLIQALSNFTESTLRDNQPTGRAGTLSGTVMNLSLGIHADRAPVPDTVAALIKDLAAQLPPEQAAVVADGVPALRILIWTARQLGAVVVAAAGNDSAGAPSAAPMQFPAAWGEAIGVGASNLDGARACYSNTADILAPGGDGGPEDPQTGQAPCVPRVDTCQDAWCGYGVVSVVTEATSPSGFAYWVGSSFATPLVSGAAALSLQNGAAAGEAEAMIMGARDPGGVLVLAPRP